MTTSEEMLADLRGARIAAEEMLVGLRRNTELLRRLRDRLVAEREEAAPEKRSRLTLLPQPPEDEAA